MAIIGVLVVLQCQYLKCKVYIIFEFFFGGELVGCLLLLFLCLRLTYEEMSIFSELFESDRCKVDCM